MNARRIDRRVQRTRAALVNAFTQLFFEHGYDGFTIADIIERADVGRSTFYEHFRGKNALLAETVQRPFAALAGAVDRGARSAALIPVLEHVRANRESARATMGRDASRRALTRVLSAMIEQRLALRTPSIDRRTARLRLASLALAQAEMGVIAAWATAQIAGEARDVADILHALAQSAATALATR
ncbi:MAG: helix-turn-helix domain-containing protein [Rhodanobacteraceae bacterium]